MIQAVWPLVMLALLLSTEPASAQGAVMPSFGDGDLILEGDGYGAGERVRISVTATGTGQDFDVVADGDGRFRLDTQLAIPSLSAVEIEATDEQGMTQATKTSAPGGGVRPQGGNLPP